MYQTYHYVIFLTDGVVYWVESAGGRRNERFYSPALLWASWLTTARDTLRTHSNQINTHSNLALFSEPLWIFMNLYEAMWTIMNLCVPLWTSMKLYEPLWSYMNIYESLWTLTNHDQKINIFEKNHIQLLTPPDQNNSIFWEHPTARLSDETISEFLT